MLPDVMIGMWGGKKLPYDAEVEYIGSTGSQYINTEIAASSDVEMSAIVETYAQPQNSKVFFGAIRSKISPTTRFSAAINTNGDVFSYCGTSISVGYFKIPFGGAGKELRLNNNGVWYDGVKVVGLSGETFTTDVNIYIFARCVNNTSVDSTASFRLHGASIKIKGILESEMVPVRFTNEEGVSEGAMYDKVSGKLFRNAGTGTFIIGPDK